MLESLNLYVFQILSMTIAPDIQLSAALLYNLLLLFDANTYCCWSGGCGSTVLGNCWS